MNGLRFSNFFSKSGALLIYFSMDRNLFAVLFYTWNEEVCACLHRAGFETQPLEESQLLSMVYTQVTGRITPTGAIGTIRSSR